MVDGSTTLVALSDCRGCMVAAGIDTVVVAESLTSGRGTNRANLTSARGGGGGGGAFADARVGPAHPSIHPSIHPPIEPAIQLVGRHKRNTSRIGRRVGMEWDGWNGWRVGWLVDQPTTTTKTTYVIPRPVERAVPADVVQLFRLNGAVLNNRLCLSERRK